MILKKHLLNVALLTAKPVKIENAVDDDDIALIDQATEEIVEAFNG